MGRQRKAQLNAVVLLHLPRYGVVVDYKEDPPCYLVVETDAIGRSPHGPAVWRDSSELTATGKIARRARRIWRKNVSPEERGCACQCCEHSSGYEPEPED